MAEERGQLFCAVCNRYVAATRPACSHVLHFIVSVFFWPWFIVWILRGLSDQAGGFRCNHCGWQGPANEGYRTAYYVTLASLLGVGVAVAVKLVAMIYR